MKNVERFQKQVFKQLGFLHSSFSVPQSIGPEALILDSADALRGSRSAKLVRGRRGHFHVRRWRRRQTVARTAGQQAYGEGQTQQGDAYSIHGIRTPREKPARTE